MTETLPTLLEGATTRDTLHRYCKVAGALRRMLSPSHPLWWHISLAAYSEGLTTTPIEISDHAGTDLEIRLNLRRHRLEIVRGSESRELDLTAGLTATELGERTTQLLADLGVEGEFDASHYADDGARLYDPGSAEEYLLAVQWVASRFTNAAQEIGGDTGPIQLWPHHFDLSFEWFGTRTITSEGEAEAEGSRAQIGFGFSLGDNSVSEPYFYATPWPFEQQITSHELPLGAAWYQDQLKGALLLYETLAAEPGTLLEDFIKTVHSVASPGLAV